MNHSNNVFSCNDKECRISLPVLIGAAALVFLMLLTILILSICLGRVCQKLKKRKVAECMSDDDEEANLHYAELQNLPISNRVQCNGGTCEAAASLPVAQNNDYATVAELKGPEDGACDQEANEDNRGDDGMVENQPPVEME